MNLPFWRKPLPSPPPTEFEQVFRAIRRMEARLIQEFKIMAQTSAEKYAHITDQLAALKRALDEKSASTDTDIAALDAITATVDALVAEHVPAAPVALVDSTTGVEAETSVTIDPATGLAA